MLVEKKEEKKRKKNVTYSVLAQNTLIGFLLLCSVTPP